MVEKFQPFGKNARKPQGGYFYLTHPVYCMWFGQAPRNQVINLRFVGDFAIYCSFGCSCYHWVEVKYKANLGREGPR